MYLVYAPPPALPSLHVALQLILLERRPNASICFCLQILCTKPPHSLHRPYPLIPNCSWILFFSHEKVESFLANINSHYVTDRDSISAFVLKTYSALLAQSPSARFTQSFSLGKFPSAWKLTNIIAIHKHGGKLIILTTDILACFQLQARL